MTLYILLYYVRSLHHHQSLKHSHYLKLLLAGKALPRDRKTLTGGAFWSTAETLPNPTSKGSSKDLRNHPVADPDKI